MSRTKGAGGNPSPAPFVSHPPFAPIPTKADSLPAPSTRPRESFAFMPRHQSGKGGQALFLPEVPKREAVRPFEPSPIAPQHPDTESPAQFSRSGRHPRHDPEHRPSPHLLCPFPADREAASSAKGRIQIENIPTLPSLGTGQLRSGYKRESGRATSPSGFQTKSPVAI